MQNEEEKEKGFFGFFKKASNKMEVMKARYDKVEVNIEKITSALEEHQVKYENKTRHAGRRIRLTYMVVEAPAFEVIEVIE